MMVLEYNSRGTNTVYSSKADEIDADGGNHKRYPFNPALGLEILSIWKFQFLYAIFQMGHTTESFHFDEKQQE